MKNIYSMYISSHFGVNQEIKERMNPINQEFNDKRQKVSLKEKWLLQGKKTGRKKKITSELKIVPEITNAEEKGEGTKGEGKKRQGSGRRWGRGGRGECGHSLQLSSPCHTMRAGGVGAQREPYQQVMERQSLDPGWWARCCD